MVVRTPIERKRMPSVKAKVLAQSNATRWVVCSLLVPLLILSGLSFDICITHAHADGQLHTHVNRVLGVNDAEHHCHQHCHQHGHEQHEDHHGGSDPSHLPIQPDSIRPGFGQHSDPHCCCTAEPVSTVIVSSAGHLTRQGQREAKACDGFNLANCCGYALPDAADARSRRGNLSWALTAMPGQVVRSVVLLI